MLQPRELAPVQGNERQPGNNRSRRNESIGDRLSAAQHPWMRTHKFGAGAGDVEVDIDNVKDEEQPERLCFLSRRSAPADDFEGSHRRNGQPCRHVQQAEQVARSLVSTQVAH